MAQLRVEILGEDLFCADQAAGGEGVRRPLTEERLAKLRDWAARYDRAVQSNETDALAGIGQEIAALLNEGDGWLDRVLDGTGEIQFEIGVSGNPTERERVLLDVPWELMAPQGIFLAVDELRLFRVARRLGKPAQPV